MRTFVALALLVTFDLMAEARLYPGLLKESKLQPVGKVRVRDTSSRITDGQTASRGQFPWQAALIIDHSRMCGGSLISVEWVLTAGQCIGTSYKITLGAVSYLNPEEGSDIVSSTTSILHEGYEANEKENDIGLVKIIVSYNNYISFIRLPSRVDQSNTFAGENVRVSGWGRISDDDPHLSEMLQYVDLTVITNDECKEAFITIGPDELCTSTTGGKSICGSDVGGALVYAEYGYIQIGIASRYSTVGCESGLPAVFTRVTSYLDWIQSHTGIIIN
ncbi:brachyurin-like isoform X2 [Periplaneta americana]|uniref:brachyurin-like isoform X2 n=1 Tax=Periplaneta americana TaxID=6978 RepID=UPI0037E8D8B1